LPNPQRINYTKNTAVLSIPGAGFLAFFSASFLSQSDGSSLPQGCNQSLAGRWLPSAESVRKIGKPLLLNPDIIRTPKPNSDRMKGLSVLFNVMCSEKHCFFKSGEELLVWFRVFDRF